MIISHNSQHDTFFVIDPENVSDQMHWKLRNARWVFNQYPHRMTFSTDNAFRAAEFVAHMDESAYQACVRHNTSEQKVIEPHPKWELSYPDHFTPRDYQVEDVIRMLNQPATLNTIEMGLGKTPETIMVINTDKSIKRVLIVCPTSIQYQWRTKLKELLTRPMTIGIANANNLGLADIIIMSLDMFVRYHEMLVLLNNTPGMEIDLMVIDEAQSFKTIGGKRAAALAKMIGVRRRIALTGTPVENVIEDFFNIVNWLDPETWINRRQVRQYATNPGKIAQILKAKLMIRRRVVDHIAQMPPISFNLIEYPFPEGTDKDTREKIKRLQEELALWERNQSLIAEIQAMGLDKIDENNELYQQKLSELKGVQSAFFSEMSTLRRITGEIKVPYAIQYLTDLTGREVTPDGVTYDGIDGGVVVFAHHGVVIDELAKAFPDFAVIRGSSSKAQRQKAVQDFRDKKTKGIILSIRAAALGIDELQYGGHNVVHVEFDWTSSRTDQANARVWRQGQTNTVIVHTIVIDGTLDAKLAKTIVRKGDLAAKSVGDKIDPNTEQTNIYVAPIGRPSVIVQEIAQNGHKQNGDERREQIRMVDELAHTERLTPTVIQGLFHAIKIAANNETKLHPIDAEFIRNMAREATLSHRQLVVAKYLLKDCRSLFNDSLYWQIYN